MDNKQFIIAQLRQDKIIYAVEACATNLACLLIFIFAGQYLENSQRNIVEIGAIILGVSYTLFMGVGNFIRLQKIKKLESDFVNAN